MKPDAYYHVKLSSVYMGEDVFGVFLQYRSKIPLSEIEQILTEAIPGLHKVNPKTKKQENVKVVYEDTLNDYVAHTPGTDYFFPIFGDNVQMSGFQIMIERV